MKTLKINWELSYLCNNYCSYCFHKDKKSKYYPDKQLIVRLLKFIYNMDIEKYSLSSDNFSFSLLGGEPTVYPHLSYLIDKINEIFSLKLVKIRLITNGIKNLNIFLKNNVEFFISVHFENFSDNLFNNIKILQKNNISFKMSIMFDIRYKNKCYDFIKYVEDNNLQDKCKLSLIKKYPLFDSILDEYSDKDIIYVKTKNSLWNNIESNSILLNDESNFHCKCIHNENFLYLNPTMQWRGSMCSQSKYSFLPLYMENKIEKNEIICKQKKCNCLSNIHINKIKRRL